MSHGTYVRSALKRRLADSAPGRVTDLRVNSRHERSDMRSTPVAPSRVLRRAGRGRVALPRTLNQRREEHALFVSYQRNGDPAARRELVERFLPLARRLARRYEQA